MSGSLRTRLVLSTALASAAVLAAAGVLLYALARDGLLDQFDRALLDKAQLLASAVEREHDKVELEFDELDMREFRQPLPPAYLWLRGSDGSALFRSSPAEAPDLEGTGPPDDSPALRPVTLPGGRAGRAVAIRFVPRADEDDETEADGEPAGGKTAIAGLRLTLILARETAPVDATLARFRAALVAVGLAAMAVSAGLLWLFVRRGLRPVEGLANRIARLGEQDLSARVEAPDVPRELQPVVGRLNDLLGRLETAFERERRFSADVAHELRTPLAGLRSTMDVTLTKPRDAAQYAESLRGCLRITTQMQAMIEHLLALGRLDAGRIDLYPEPVPLNQVIRDAWQPLAGPAEARNLHVAWRLGEDARIVTDPALLGLVIRNVLENAVLHTDEGGTVTVETRAGANAIEIHATNSGSRLSQEQADHAFERFWRGDAARTDAGVHCGLGLPLVKRAAEALGGAVLVRSTAGGEFRITVSLPLGAPHP